ncbi:putative exported protein [Rubellimicrobium mesophilum DSM 19309]|uniref:Putative exported protein n=1 Tax=Rubellimicrobium mesophilum DSM 19309 TaxID=442562 RepID=A0A017HUS3_9RHOB|nr:DUF1513 domain-containing protein [Rubellimicrobium mesophilum]EYD77913.1 putative exported protein [Rubellimicrobium mesophilum DSM 19309]
MATRRGFLASLLAAASLPSLGWAEAGSPSHLACAGDPDGTFSLHGLRSDGTEAFRLPLPARGHAGCGHPTEALAVVFARRPGTFALVLDCARGTVRRRLSPPEGRAFNGHGTFLAGGAVLATSEQATGTSEGVLGLWDVEGGFRRMGEVPTGGVGPHDLKRLESGQVLVANGGIATDPTDRTKLNIATMRPNLSLLDPLGDGVAEVTELSPDLHQASIRHLALRADGTVGFAMQWEGDPDVLVPLLGLRASDGTITLAQPPEAEARLMQGYAGSVAWSGDGIEVAITSPKGGRIQRFDAQGRFLGHASRPEVCGIAPLGTGFLLSDGLGGLLALQGDEVRPLARAEVAWDNHVVTL